MPLLQDVKNANMSGVANGSLATVQVPTGDTIYDLYLYATKADGTPVDVAALKSELVSVRLRLGGDLVIDCPPEILLDMQKFYGDANGAGNVAGVIPMHFASMILNNPQAVSLYALGTYGLNSISIEVRCGTLSQIASIEVYRSVSNEQRVLGLHHRILPYPQTFGSTGIQEISTLPTTQDMAYESLHVKSLVGVIADASVRVGKVDVLEQIPANLQNVILKNTKRTPQPNFYHMIFNRLNAVDSALPMAKVTDFRQKLNWSTSPAGNFDIYAIEVHGLEIKTIRK